MGRLFSSSKALLGLIISIGVVVLAVLHTIDGKDALDTLKWLAITFMGSTAVEDATRAIAARPVAAKVPATMVINNSMPPPAAPSSSSEVES
jgi:hypothetical protein